MIIGHQKIWQFLKKSVETDRLSHAYLFSGEEHLGKKTLALEWISLMLGQDLLKKGHPDFFFVEPIEKEIKISQIREVISRLSLSPFLANLKVAIIDQAHLMNIEAQNCFLKTLEEPKGNTILILISEAPERLLPTILSRCEMIKFYPVEKKEIEEYFKKQEVSEEKIKEIIKISMGRPGMAIDFFSDPQKLENQKKVVADLTKIIDSDLNTRFKYAKNLSQENNVREVLNIWLSYFRETLINHLNQPKADSGKISKDSLSKLKNILQNIQNTNFLISTTNVNSRLALETLMLEF